MHGESRRVIGLGMNSDEAVAAGRASLYAALPHASIFFFNGAVEHRDNSQAEYNSRAALCEYRFTRIHIGSRCISCLSLDVEFCGRRRSQTTPQHRLTTAQDRAST